MTHVAPVYLPHRSNKHRIVSGHNDRARTHGMPNTKPVQGGQYYEATCVLFTPGSLIRVLPGGLWPCRIRECTKCFWYRVDVWHFLLTYSIPLCGGTS